ncbi:MAG: phenylalanine--tRNA ligase subunit alpha [Cardiobacteriaceae bacterium]|nr:phenylalanine--tRNA ligase subunit alpha [Cardiobacteriaceae bacterium]
MSLSQQLEQILAQALAELETVSDLSALENIKNTYLSKKGSFAEFSQMLAKASAEERPQLGKIINETKSALVAAFESKQTVLQASALQAKLAAERIDITLSRPLTHGSLHPVTLTRRRIEAWFSRLGFVVKDGPEMEDDFHNFEALNIPKHHPARAMQDTFYINPQIVLRTHTSGVQIRTMEQEGAPLRIIAPGRVYRSDSDMTHTPMFHQVEGLVIDKHSTFADLKSIIIDFLQDFFKDNEVDELKIQFRPSFFPFTEPSAEVDIAFVKEGKQSRWLEVLGCGMVHPQVLRNSGVNPNDYQGYAFGMGIERLAMLRYGAPDLRQFFENDVRFLRQFRDKI